MTKENQKVFHKNTGTYIILGLSLCAMAFFGVCTPEPRGGGNQLGAIAGSVEGEHISKSEFSRAYSGQRERLQSRYGENFNAQVLKVASTTIDQLIDSYILFIEAKKLGLTASDNQIVRYLKEIKLFRDKDNKFSEEYFHRYLQSNLYSEVSFQEEVRKDLTIEHLRDLVSNSAFVSSAAVELDYQIAETKLNVDYIKVDPDKIQVSVTADEIAKFMSQKGTPEKIKSYYDSHKSDFSSPEKVRARHILISYVGARNAASGIKRTKVEAKSKADALVKELKDKKADFVTLAKQMTDEESGKKSGGDLGFFTKDSMVKEFSDAAFTLTPGTISEAVESPFGFHIIQSLEKKAKVETALVDATSTIATLLIKKERSPELAKTQAEALQKSFKEGKGEELLKQYQLKWEKTGNFALNSSYIPTLGSNQDILDAVMKLAKVGDLSEKPVMSQKSYFIFRLGSKDQADLKKLDDSKKEELAQTGKYMLGYSYFKDFEVSAREKLEKKKAIYKNPQYLAIDEQKEDIEP